MTAVSANGVRADALAQAGVSPCDLDAILVTHEHNDHISGVGVMSRGYDIPVYANEKTWAAMEGSLGRMAEENKKTFSVGESFEINGVGIESFAIPHDAACPVGYSLFTEGLKLSVATDMGHIDESVVGSICGSDIVLLEANHDLTMLQNGRYPAALKRRISGEIWPFVERLICADCGSPAQERHKGDSAWPFERRK